MKSLSEMSEDYFLNETKADKYYNSKRTSLNDFKELLAPNKDTYQANMDLAAYEGSTEGYMQGLEDFKTNLVDMKAQSTQEALDAKLLRLGGDSATKNNTDEENDGYIEQTVKGWLGMDINRYGKKVRGDNLIFNEKDPKDTLINHLMKQDLNYDKETFVENPNPKFEEPTFLDTISNPAKLITNIYDAGKEVYRQTTDEAKAENAKYNKDKKILEKQFKENHYTDKNGKFNMDKLQELDDPTASSVFYVYEVQVPKTKENPTGLAQKIGYTDRATFIRRTEDGRDGKLLLSIRTNGAEVIENLINGSKIAITHRAYDKGSKMERSLRRSGEVGISEVYNGNILNLNLDGERKTDMGKVLDSQFMSYQNNKSTQKHDGILETVDTFQAGGAKSVYGILEGVAAAGARALGHTSTEKTGLEKYFNNLGKNADKDWGYNPKNTRKGQIASANAKTAFENGQIGTGISYMFESMFHQGPEAIASSAPNMAAMGVAAAAGLPALALTGLAIGVGTANKVLNDREKANGGKANSLVDSAAVTAASTLLTYLEYGVVKFSLLGKGKSSKAEFLDVNKLLKTADTPTKIATIKEFAKIATKTSNVAPKTLSALKAIGKGTGTAAVAATAEGTEEVFSEMVKTTLGAYGTEKYKGKTITEILSSDKSILNLINSFNAGAGAGATISSPRAIGKSMKSLGTDIGERDVVRNSSTVTSDAERTDRLDTVSKEIEETKTKYTTINTLNKSIDSIKDTEALKEAYTSVGLPVDKLSGDLTKDKAALRSLLNNEVLGIKKALPQLALMKETLTTARIANKNTKTTFDHILNTVTDVTKKDIVNVKNLVKTSSIESLQGIVGKLPKKLNTIIADEIKVRENGNTMYNTEVGIEPTEAPVTKVVDVKDIKKAVKGTGDTQKQASAKFSEHFNRLRESLGKDVTVSQALGAMITSMDKDTAKHYVKLKDRLESAGLGDRKLGVGIEQVVPEAMTSKYDVIVTEDLDNIVDTNLKTSKKERVKDVAYNTPKTYEGLHELFTDPIKSLGKILLTKSDKLEFKPKTVFSPKVVELFNRADKIPKLEGKFFGEDTKENSVKAKVMLTKAISVITDAIVAKKNLDNNLRFRGEPNIVASNEDTIHEIGKQVLDVFGLNVHGNSKEVAKLRLEIGQASIDLAKELGVIEDVDKVSMPFNPKKMSFNDKPLEGVVSPFVSKKNTVKSYVTKGFKFTGTEGLTLEDVVASSSEFNKLNKLFSGRNLETPTPRVQPRVESDTIPTEYSEALKELESKPFFLKKEFIEVLEPIHKRWVSIQDQSDNNKYNFLKENYSSLFDLDNKSDFADAFSDTDSGRNIQNIKAIADILDDFEALKNNPLYYSYKVASNGRAHINQTVLDFQGDKKFARSILTDSKEAETITTYEGWRTGLNSLSEELGITPSEILKGSTDTALEKLITIIEKGNLKDYALIANTVLLDGHSSFQAMELAQAVIDYRTGYKTNTEVVTSYVPEIDAKSSGVVNSILNYFGYSKGMEDLLDTVGVLNGSKEVDGYKPLEKGLQKLLDIYGESKLSSDMQILLDTKAYTSVRDMVKSPVMTFFYASKIENIVDRLSLEMAEKIINNAVRGNKPAQKFLRDTLGEPNINFKTINKEQVDTIAQYFSKKDSIATQTGSLARNIFHPVTEIHDNFIDPIYKLLDKVSKEDPTYIPTINSPFNPTDRSKGIELTQEKQVKIGETSDGMSIYKNSKENNLASAKVVPLHMIDAFIEYSTVSKAKLDRAMMAIHDALKGGGDKLATMVDVYNKIALETAQEFDIISALRDELIFAQDITKDSTTIKEIDSLLDKINPQIEKAKQAKAEMFKDKKLNAIGVLTAKESDFVELYNNNKPVEQSTKVEQSTDVKVKQSAEIKEAFDSFFSKPTPKTTHPKLTKLFGLAQKDLASTPKRLLDIIEDYLSVSASKVISSDFSMYFPESDTIEAITNIKDSEGNYRVDPRFTLTDSEVMLNKPAMLELFAHEINHSKTVNYLISLNITDKKTGVINESKAPREVKVILKHMRRLRKNFLETLDGDEELTLVQERAAYALYHGLTYSRAFREAADTITEDQLAEFAAVMDAEPEYAREILNLNPNKNYTQKQFDRMVADVRAWIAKAINHLKGVKTTELEDTQLYKALAIFSSHTVKETEGKPLGAGYFERSYEALTRPINSLDKIASGVVHNTALPFITKQGKVALEWGNKKTNSKILKKMLDESLNMINHGVTNVPYINEFLFYMGSKRRVNKDNFNKILTKITNLSQEKQRHDSAILGELKAVLTDNFSKKEIIGLNDVFGLSDISSVSYYNEKMFAALIDGTMTIDEAIAEYSPKVSKELNTIAENTGKYYITKEVIKTEGLINTGNVDIFGHDKTPIMRPLTALYALKQADPDLKILQGTYKKSKNIFNDLVGLNTQVNFYNDRIMYGEDVTHEFKLHKDVDSNGVNEYYDKSWNFKVVTYDQWANTEFPNGTVIRKPTKNTYGVVAIENTKTYSESLGLNYNRHRNDIWLKDIDSSIDEESDSIVRFTNGAQLSYKLVLSKKEKIKLGLIQNPADTLIRTLANSQELLDSEYIRDMLVEKEVEDISTKEAIDSMVEKIDDKESDLPWFVRLPDNFEFDTEYNNLPESIKREYKPAPIMTDFRNFNGRLGKRVLVQRTIEPYVLGYERYSAVSNNSTPLKKSIDKWYKHSVVMFKLSVAVRAPMKLLADFISNNAILLAKGLSPIEMAKYSQEGLKLNNEMANIRNEIEYVKFRIAKDPTNTSLQDKRDKLIKKMEKHPFYAAVEGGFIQSLSTSIVQKDFESVQGLQKDIERVLEVMFRKENGNLNKGGKLLMNILKTKGLSIESVTQAIATKAKHKNKDISKIAQEVTDKIKHAKSHDQLENILTELLGSPSSASVQLGSYVMQVADIASRWSLYKYNIKNGMSKENAVADSLNTFIDYRLNKPKIMQVASDYGVVDFPTFLAKVQPVIANLILQNPIKSTAAILLSNYYDFSSSTIYGSNILTRENIVGIHNPIEEPLFLFN